MDGVWPILACAAAALPAGMILVNLGRYRPLPPVGALRVPTLSVLIPARNEAANIRAALESVLASEGLGLEVLVWDDSSTDATAEIVESFARTDARVRLLRGVPPPAGWAGKPFGCHSLAREARGEVLLFLDADVRIRKSDSLARIASAFNRTDLDLLSGIPAQITTTLPEALIVPLIHFVLLGFLPIQKMRTSGSPSFAAACGQLLAVRAAAYHACGGHAPVRNSFHEGITMARSFRKQGRRTDLFDASETATCRMYEGWAQVWNGFAKNAHEGLASPRSVVPMSALLLFGQVAPVFLLFSGAPSKGEVVCAALAAFLGMAARAVLAARFHQPVAGVLLHPVSVALLLLIQWYGALRFLLGIPVGWRGRTLAALALLASFTTSPRCLGQSQPSPASPYSMADAPQSVGPEKCPNLELADQHGTLHALHFPRTRALFLVAATRAGSKHISEWVKPVAEAFGDKIDILGLADVRNVPSSLQGVVRRAILSGTEWPVLLDWKGDFCATFLQNGASIQVHVIHPAGQVSLKISGNASAENLARIQTELQKLTRGVTRTESQ